MIFKNYELNKKNFEKINLYLLYGKNEGFQNEVVEKYFLNNFDGKINKYEENEFINLSDVIIGELLNRSLFDEKKIIIISRVTDKILKYVEEIAEKKLEDIKNYF